MLAAGLLGAPFVLARGGDAQAASCGLGFVATTLLGELAFLGSVLLWVLVVRRAPIATLGPPRKPWGDLGVGFGIGLALVFIAAMVGLAVQAVFARATGHPAPQPEQVPACITGSVLLFLAPVVVLGAPLGEEPLFRGFLYRGLRRRMPVWAAAVISGVVFGAVHVIPASARVALSTALLIPPLAVVGIGLAVLYESRRSLLASMVAHATFNLVGFTFIALSRAG